MKSYRPNEHTPSTWQWYEWIYIALLLVVVGVLYATAPRHGEFEWGDAARNALDGAFMLDLVKDLPFQDPVGWAQRYYYQYPALTILFHPPLLGAALALFYLFFGVSHASGMACVSSFALALALGMYTLAKRIMRPPAAIAASLLLLATPAVVTWAQQIMFEIPMMAFAVWAAVFFLKYGESDRWQDLFVSATLMVAAIYTKQIAGIIGASLFVSLLLWRGGKILISRRHIWFIGIYAIVALVPLAIVQQKYGKANISLVVGQDWSGVVDRSSLQGILWYAKHMPGMLGYPTFAFVLMGIGGCLIRRDWRPPKGDLLVYVCWFVIGYAAQTAIFAKEARYVLHLTVPMVMVAALCLDRLLMHRQFEKFAAPVIAALLYAWTIWHDPTPWIDGYNKVAAYVAAVAPKNGRILFVGNQDGNFIFNMRTHEERRDLSVIRADKLFLNVAFDILSGANPKDYTPEQIKEMLNRLGVSYVVTIPRVWEKEAPVMAHLADVLASEQFAEETRIPLTGTTLDRELIVYRNLSPLPESPAGFDMELRGFGLSFKQKTAP